MDIVKFKNNIKKVSGNRKHSVINSHGIKDFFVYYKQIRPNYREFVLSDSQYRTLIRKVNKLLIEEFINSGELKFPLDMGFLRIYGRESKPVFKEGKLRYNAPVDWNKTLELWANDSESRVSKTLVKLNPGIIYSIKCSTNNCKFKNKGYYLFKPNRTVKLKLKNKINNKESITYYNKYKNNGRRIHQYKSSIR